MLNCRDVSERASDFLDATLPFRVRQQMRIHLMMCRFCREYIRQMALVVRTLSQLPRPQPEAETKAALIALFREQH